MNFYRRQDLQLKTKNDTRASDKTTQYNLWQKITCRAAVDIVVPVMEQDTKDSTVRPASLYGPKLVLWIHWTKRALRTLRSSWEVGSQTEHVL